MSNTLRDIPEIPVRHSGVKSASIVVVAKVPTPGSSKTRLIPELGDEGAASFAEAMLCDVLSTISNTSELDDVDKILLFAPPGPESRMRIENILQSYRVPTHWSLLPIQENAVHLKSSQLSSILQDALQVAQKHAPGPVVFLGMDSPELPIAELIAATRNDDYSLLCPAGDGGYGLLSVPSTADTFCFSGVLWSHPLTAISQLKALSDQNINVRIGTLMNDIDDEQDLFDLCDRILRKENDMTMNDFGCLSRPSPLAGPIPIQRTPEPEDHNVQPTSSTDTFSSWLGGSTTKKPSNDKPRAPVYRPLQYTKRMLIQLGKLPDDIPPPPPDTSSPDGILADLLAVWRNN